MHQNINIVEIIIPCAPPTDQCRENSELQKFGRSMSNFSIVIDQDLIVDIFIINVRVRSTIIWYAKYMEK